eukprot:2195801-Amphidinium_carterae.1
MKVVGSSVSSQSKMITELFGEWKSGKVVGMEDLLQSTYSTEQGRLGTVIDGEAGVNFTYTCDACYAWSPRESMEA